MNATEVKGSQGAGLVGGSDAVSQAVTDAESAARTAAEAARKAAEAAAAAAAEKNAQKARELEAQAKKLAETAAKAAQKASNAAAKLAGALENLENRGKADPKLAAASEKATAAAKAAKTSAAAASNSAAAATKARQQKPVDRYENMKDRKLELNPQPPPSAKPSGPVYGPPAPAKEKQWHPPMAPPSQPAPGLTPFTPRQPAFLTPPAPPKPLTPTERLELARERKLELADRTQPTANKIQFGYANSELAHASQVEIKQGNVKELNSPTLGQDPNKVPVGRYAFGAGVDTTSELNRSVKASPPQLQPGSGLQTVTFEVKQESKIEVSPGFTADNWVAQGRAGYKHSVAQEITYELTVPASEAQRYQLNPQDAPDPYNVHSLPVGSTLVIKVDDVRGNAIELEAARTVGLLPSKEKPEPFKPGEKPIENARPHADRVLVGGRIETGGSQSTGTSVAVERVGENTVRLLAGPTEGMKGAFGLTGFVGNDSGTFEASGKVEIERSFSSQNLTAVELDLTNPGADAAYAYFLRNGTLPPEGVGPVGQSSEVYQTSYKTGGKLEAGGRFGSMSGSASVNTEYGIDEKRTFDSDGAVSNEFNVNTGDRALQINTSYDAAGNLDPEKSGTGYVVRGAPPEVAEGIQRSFHPPGAKELPRLQGPQDLEVKLTQAQATELNTIAKQYVADWENETNQRFNSAAEPMIWALATAQSPEEVSTSLIQAGGRHEDYYGLTDLADFHKENTGKQLPGAVTVMPTQQ